MVCCMPAVRPLRTFPRKLARPTCFLSSCQSFLSLQSRHLTAGPPSSPSTSKERPREGLDSITLHRLEAERRAYYKRRSIYAGFGFVVGMIAIWVTATSIELPSKPAQMDSGLRPDDPPVILGRERKVIVQKMREEPEDIVDVVETGTSTVPTFPRLLDFYDEKSEGKISDDNLVEYQLVGLGIRTVSFLGIQVYVVGMYIATDDIATLREALIRKIDPIATTLVAGEKEKLKSVLVDPARGEDVWNQVLKDSGCRTLIRIVPTRDTDFHHLRDAWVRSITNRAQRNKDEFGDDEFGLSVNNFKTLFRSGSLPKRKELLLSRDGKGKLSVWFDNGKSGAQRLGEVEDERISRAVWLNYLAGKTPASESARKSIIEGVMEFVERPVSTVATQVHV